MIRALTTFLILFLFSCPSFAQDEMTWGTLPGQSLSKDFVRGVNRTLKVLMNFGEAPKEPCSYGQRAYGTTKIKDYSGQDIEVSLTSEQLAQELFNKVSRMDHIPFDYPEDGCYARAHEMARALEKEGIVTAKAFIEGNLRVETANSPKGYVEWWYHVAPIIQVNVNGEQKSYVIDPSIFDRAVPIEEWHEIQTSHAKGRKDHTYVTRRFSYTPFSRTSDHKSYQENHVDHTINTMKNYTKVVEKRAKESQR